MWNATLSGRASPVGRPPGSLVAFTADHHVPNVRELYVANADGSDVRRLTDLSAYDQDGDGVPARPTSPPRPTSRTTSRPCYPLHPRVTESPAGGQGSIPVCSAP
jgi:hypothetical protein